MNKQDSISDLQSELSLQFVTFVTKQYSESCTSEVTDVQNTENKTQVSCSDEYIIKAREENLNGIRKKANKANSDQYLISEEINEIFDNKDVTNKVNKVKSSNHHEESRNKVVASTHQRNEISSKATEQDHEKSKKNIVPLIHIEDDETSAELVILDSIPTYTSRTRDDEIKIITSQEMMNLCCLSDESESERYDDQESITLNTIERDYQKYKDEESTTFFIEDCNCFSFDYDYMEDTNAKRLKSKKNSTGKNEQERYHCKRKNLKSLDHSDHSRSSFDLTEFATLKERTHLEHSRLQENQKEKPADNVMISQETKERKDESEFNDGNSPYHNSNNTNDPQSESDVENRDNNFCKQKKKAESKKKTFITAIGNNRNLKLTSIDGKRHNLITRNSLPASRGQGTTPKGLRHVKMIPSSTTKRIYSGTYNSNSYGEQSKAWSRKFSPLRERLSPINTHPFTHINASIPVVNDDNEKPKVMRKRLGLKGYKKDPIGNTKENHNPSSPLKESLSTIDQRQIDQR